MGGKPKSTSQSYSGSSNPAFQPMALSAAGNVQSVFNQNQPNLQALTGQATNIANTAAGNFGAGQPNLGAARGYVGDVLAGKYLNGNPAIAQMLARLRGDTLGAVNSNYAGAGRYGSAYHDNAVARGVADAEAPILYQNYSDEMGRMGEAANAAQGMSAADYNAALAGLGVSAELPYTGSNALANSLGALFSGGQDKSKQTGASPIWGAIGSGLGAAATAFSDRRLKTNVRRIGEYADGLGRYLFAYIWGGPEHEGVMADEVAELRPWALGPMAGGYATVDYSRL
ncbi:MAG TPA: hypothetical protein VLA99_05925 [Nitrospiraceae bacterium]|nr:hypothetical protein [Nitrospiraceae bacterium]